MQRRHRPVIDGTRRCNCIERVAGVVSIEVVPVLDEQFEDVWEQRGVNIGMFGLDGSPMCRLELVDSTNIEQLVLSGAVLGLNRFDDVVVGVAASVVSAEGRHILATLSTVKKCC